MLKLSLKKTYQPKVINKTEIGTPPNGPSKSVEASHKKLG
jgi:hypothetical protein